jgi:hypothetical protein
MDSTQIPGALLEQGNQTYGLLHLRRLHKPLTCVTYIISPAPLTDFIQITII